MPERGHPTLLQMQLRQYCSQKCQKQFWSVHKKRCTSFLKEPVHELVSSDPKAPNYYKADAANPKSLDHPSVYIDIQNEGGDEPPACLDYRLQRHILDLTRDSTFTELAKWEDIQHWFRVVHEETPAAERQAVMETWSQIDSPVRVVITSPLSKLDLIVPDVENVIFFSKEDRVLWVRDSSVWLGWLISRVCTCRLSGGKDHCFIGKIPEIDTLPHVQAVSTVY
ncbi:hypothetical protein DL95DRAFT_456576 [Leptodontidium sp. 2 PMI_412]|nr:hypothetical protein DL95DRAFT_456576 [Leptodontidium sp. 2 PMI_412]